MTALAEAVQRIRQASRILLVSHTSPDPDAIGSLLGLWHVLCQMDKNALPWSVDPVPHEMQFLPGCEDVVRVIPDDFKADLLIALDSSDAERLGHRAKKLVNSDVFSINLDHHLTNQQYGSINLVDDQWASTAEGVLVLIDALGQSLDLDIATCLMAGIVGDTRSFSTNAVTSVTLKAGARLRAVGADSAYITARLLHQRPYDALRLWGLGITNSRLENGVIWTTISRKERREYGLTKTPDTGLSNLLLQADEAVIAAVMTQQMDGRTKCSFRAKAGQDVAATAAALGGGGHRLAAGCLLKGDFEQVVQKVVAQLQSSVVPIASPETLDQ